MNNFRCIVAAVLALTVSGGIAVAQTAEPEIVVTGERVEEQIRNFVTALSAPPAREDQLARWDQEVCVGVIGLRARYGQFMADRISQRADEIGLQPGRPGCRANVVVFVTPDSDRFTSQLVEDFPELVAARWADNTVTQGQEALQQFMNDSRPVRWWHVANTVSADGQALGDVQTSQSGGQFRTQVIRTTSIGFGRLSRTTRQDLSRVVIVVDATRVAGRQFDALADYVAMVALSQVDPDADTRALSTILNLFTEGSPPPLALTDWDKAYLTGLYEAPRNARNAQQQQGAIARSMGGELADPPQD
jgi:hypothetical protein